LGAKFHQNEGKKKSFVIIFPFSEKHHQISKMKKKTFATFGP
jgi:hypothetical protein